MKWSAFDQSGLSALLASMLQIKRTADCSRSAAAALDAVKADKPQSVSAVVPADGWTEDSAAGYPEYYDLPAPGVTAKDRADIVVSASSMGAAVACGLCPTSETLAGKIRIRAASAPAQALNVEYWIEEGRK